jgi:phosphatidylinositol alpha-1,6-mannosyltransferase
MRLLLFTGEYPPMRTGVATYNRVLAEGLARRGHGVTVLTFRAPGARARETLAREIRIPVGTRQWLEPVRVLLGLAAYRLLAPRYDAALLSSDLAQRIVGDPRLAGATPFVCTVHGSEVTKRDPARSWGARAAWRLRLGTLRRAASVVAVSRYTRELLASGGLEADKIHVVYNGIPEVWFDAPPNPGAVADLRRRLGVRPGEVALLTLARVVRRKGHDRVLRALPLVLERFPAVRYVVAGTGEDLDRVRALAEELRLGDRVIFAGEVPEGDKRTYYDACDVFVMPSLHDGRRVEGLGISFIEAAARRKPSVGGRHGGVPEVIDDLRTGYLVDPDDIPALAERLTALAGHAELRRRLGDAAHARARERFRDTTMVNDIEGLLKRAGSGRAPRTVPRGGAIPRPA